MRSCALAGLALALVAVGSAPARAQAPPATLAAHEIEALVGPLALYPDDVIEQALLACQEPYAIVRATQPGDASQLSEPVQWLLRYPTLLEELAADPVRATRLGMAAKTQLADVWAAVDAIRARVDTATAAVQPDQATATAVATAYATPGYATAPLAGFWAGVGAAGVYNELYGAYSVYGTPLGTTAVVTGPAGGQAVVGGGSALVTDGQGNAAYGAGGSFMGTAANGQTYAGAAQVHGTATQTETGGSYDKQSSAGVANLSTGEWAAGTRDTSGYVQPNADGSVGFGRSAQTDTVSSYGSSSIDHQGAGTWAGAGQSSYQGSTSIDSTHGDASVSTSAGDGQLSTTVTTGQGSQTYSAGSGQHLPASSSDAGASSMSRQAASAPTGASASRQGPQGFQGLQQPLPGAHSGGGGTGGYSRPGAGSGLSTRSSLPTSVPPSHPGRGASTFGSGGLGGSGLGGASYSGQRGGGRSIGGGRRR